MEDKKYRIELEVMTPVSVGAGNENEWVKGLDYVLKDGKVYVIDIQKVAGQGIDIERLTNLFLKYDYRGICDLLGTHLEQVSRLIFDAPASTDNNIKPFLRTQLYDKPVIPGSSIKGSVRSALFNYLRTDEEANAEVFGNMDKGTDFMRFIRIGDVEMPGTVLLNSKIFNLRGYGPWQGGWKHRSTDRDGNSNTTGEYNPVGFNTLYECAVPGQKGVGSISLAANAFQLMAENTPEPLTHLEKKKGLMNGSLQDLFRIINNVTKNYLLKEKAFFEKYTAERSDELVDNINYLLSLIPADGSSCLIKMSAGVGFHSITGDWKYDDYDDTNYWEKGRDAGKKKYKSRKTVEYNHQIQLMGFVRLKLMDEKKFEEWEHLHEEKHRQRMEQILRPVKQREAERLLQMAEEQRRREITEAEQKKQESFERLLEQSRKNYMDGLLQEAMEKAEEAAGLYPENNEVSLLLTDIRMAQSAADFRKQEEAANVHKFGQSLAEVICGKLSAGNLIGTMAKWLKVDGHSFGETEYAVFLKEAMKLSAKEQKKIKNKRKELIKAIGEEFTLRILKDLNLS